MLSNYLQLTLHITKLSSVNASFYQNVIGKHFMLPNTIFSKRFMLPNYLQ